MSDKKAASLKKTVILSIGITILCLLLVSMLIPLLQKQTEYVEQPENPTEIQQPKEELEQTQEQENQQEVPQPPLPEENGEQQIPEIHEQESQQSEQFEQIEEVQEQEEEPSLKKFAEACGISIGTCVSYNPLKSDPNYRNILIREFNVITPENELKFESVHPLRERYIFRIADEIISFAEENGMKIRGHCLVWHNQLPSWILRGSFTREELMDILRDHIYTVVGRYKGRIYAWDVVNEAIDDNGNFRDTIWYRIIGPEYIELAFKWAHEADPDALLFYNDYNIETVNRKSNAVYNLVKQLLEKGVPIHGIGFQTHLILERPPDPKSVAENIRRFEELGLIVEITEMDVRIKEPVTSEDLIRQAEVYRDILKVCLSSKTCKTFVMWEFVDKYSWIEYTFPEYTSATIFGCNYQPKPAYEYLLTTLEECSRNK